MEKHHFVIFVTKQLQQIKYNKVILFLTDAALYMVKMADPLTVLFPNMIYLTCATHEKHNIKLGQNKENSY